MPKHDFFIPNGMECRKRLNEMYPEYGAKHRKMHARQAIAAYISVMKRRNAAARREEE